MTKHALRAILASSILVSSGSIAAAQPLELLGTECSTPAPAHCPEANCSREIMANRGSTVDPQTGRTYFLDYPCDLKKGDKVTFILSLHGAGSNGQWQRHYFPLIDYKDKYKLVIATPTAATAQPTRTWQSGPDDGHLQNIVTAITEQIGKENIKAFWLVGHSQGGLTSTRLVCTDFFKARADGFLSLSGGRIGGSAGRSSNFQNLAPRGGAPSGGRGAAPPPGGAQTRGTGLLVTSTLLFGGEGGFSPVLRAWDKKTGAVVAEIQLPGPTTGFPITYVKGGRQYIAVAARVGDAVEIVALALEAPASPTGRGQP
jgi:hypothetical protein